MIKSAKIIKLKTKGLLNGFTLVEMLVTLAIFALIATLILANFRQGQKMDELKRGTLELASNFRKVQILGMSGQVVKLCTGFSKGKPCQSEEDCEGEGESCENSVPKGGYGISIEPTQEGDSPSCEGSECPTSYTLFVDSSGLAGAFEPGFPCYVEPCYDFGLPGGENYALPEKVVIKSFDIQSSVGGYSFVHQPQNYKMDITFRPPKPIPYFYLHDTGLEDVARSDQTVKIKLEHIEINKCREIVINGFSGQVSDNSITDCNPYGSYIYPIP